MPTTIYLYLKTHNETGLQYFGMTKQDPYKYRGSGKRWKNHLFKHGNNVRTEIIFESEDKDEISDVGIFYSGMWDIVKSPRFANLKIEEGDGGFDHINDGSEEHKERCRRAAKSVKNRYVFTEQDRIAGNTSFQGKSHTEETKKKISEANKIAQKGEKNSNYGNVWCVKEDAINYEERKIFKPNQIPNGWVSCKDHRDMVKSKTSCLAVR